MGLMHAFAGPRTRPVLVRIGFSLGVFLAGLLLLELGVRLAPTGAEPRSFLIFHTALRNSGLMVEDPTLFWRLRPNQTIEHSEWCPGIMHTNALGLRGAEVSPAAAGRTRVLALGDSCTFGMLVDESKTYTSELQRRLGPSWEVMNAGVPGYSSLQGLRFARELLPAFKPDIVTALFGWNDLNRATQNTPDAHRPLLTPWQIRTRQLLLHWHTLTFLRSWRAATRQGGVLADVRTPEEAPRVNPVDFANNLARLVTLAEDAHATTVLITPPIARLEGIAVYGVAPEQLTARHHAYVTQIRELARRWRIPLVDADALVSGRPDLYDNMPPDFIHFNAAGHEKIADELHVVIRHAMQARDEPSAE